ncbi:hypothetical protein ACFW1A_08490 [Kitasatospora sp. NPDC058965]|uniref:hypothetical protein n=1 Tax=Kitasatospora sp. NPDC058965 TaxID=3346682 RepID=UPI00369F08E9
MSMRKTIIGSVAAAGIAALSLGLLASPASADGWSPRSTISAGAGNQYEELSAGIWLTAASSTQWRLGEWDVTTYRSPTTTASWNDERAEVVQVTSGGRALAKFDTGALSNDNADYQFDHGGQLAGRGNSTIYIEGQLFLNRYPQSKSSGSRPF